MKKLYMMLTGALCLVGAAHADEAQHKQLVENYCYAQSAASVCDGLQMRMDTRGTVESIVGDKAGGQSSRYQQECLTGLNRAMEDEKNGVCESAWRDFGCDGEKVKGLIQQNPFKVNEPRLCRFEG